MFKDGAQPADRQLRQRAGPAGRPLQDDGGRMAGPYIAQRPQSEAIRAIVVEASPYLCMDFCPPQHPPCGFRFSFRRISHMDGRTLPGPCTKYGLSSYTMALIASDCGHGRAFSAPYCGFRFSFHCRVASSCAAGAAAVHCHRSMHQIWTTLAHDGPDCLGLRRRGCGCPLLSKPARRPVPPLPPPGPEHARHSRRRRR